MVVRYFIEAYDYAPGAQMETFPACSRSHLPPHYFRGGIGQTRHCPRLNGARFWVQPMVWKRGNFVFGAFLYTGIQSLASCKPMACVHALLLLIALLQALGTVGDVLPINNDPTMEGRTKPITIWPLKDASQMHVHSPELAEALPSLLQEGIPVIDLGCGLGYYVAELAKRGYDTYGVEGTPDIQGIALHKKIFQADLSEPLTVPLPDGHVLSFEVAEHLSVDDESIFLDNIILHASSRLLLSWALPDACAPGRGNGHLNCRSNLYVIRQLFTRGFSFHEDESMWLRERVRGSAAYWFDGTLLVFDRLDVSSLSLHELAADAAAHVPEGSRGGIRVADSLLPCVPRVVLAEPRPNENFQIDPGDVADITLEVSLKECPPTDRRMLCALVFVNGRCWERDACLVCPRLGESTIKMTLYALPVGNYNMTILPCTTGGVASAARGVSHLFTVTARGDTDTSWQGVAAVGAGDREGGGDGSVRAGGDNGRSNSDEDEDGARVHECAPKKACENRHVGGGLGCEVERLRQRAVDIEAELAEVSSMLAGDRD